MLPRQYAYLANEPGPKMLVEMLKIYGTREVSGPGDNPEIMGWAKEIGVASTYVHDSIPWCGLCVGVVAVRANKVIPKTPLWAKSWADFGIKSPQASLGDVLVFSRDGGGHVALYVGEDHTAFHCLGGNQSDMVNITRVAKNRLYAVRRPIYNVQPANVRPIWLDGSGVISRNEA